MSDAAGGRGIRIADVLRNIVAKGASDIHLQAGAPPYMRVDGELYPFEGVPTLTPEQTEQIALAMMSESQREVFRHRHEVDFAFTIPNIARFRCNVLRQRGSVGVVMRVIRDAIPSFESLGLPGNVVTDLSSQPRGLVLVTGPTGSGKTTTLAAMIDFINRRFARNIITVEDPIEYELAGVNQVQVKPDIGFTFATALRSILRQDPDIVMIGEMRDQETAHIGVEAALTGHQVFSTLHTNDAAGAITRLTDMDIEPFLTASSLSLACAQRLMRRICVNCKEPQKVPESLWEQLRLDPKKEAAFTYFKGRGCDRCKNKGYAGRCAALEMIPISEAIRKLVIERATASEIKQAALQEGMITLREAGLLKAREGISTLEEVLNVTASD